jgi:ferrous iron transport protein A
MNEVYLINLKEGEKAIITSIVGGWQATKRLADLGLTPNTQIKILRKALMGPLEIEVKNSRLVIGRGLASKILVQPL